MPRKTIAIIDTISSDQKIVIKQLTMKGDKDFYLQAYIKEPVQDKKIPAILLLGGMMTGKRAVNYAYNVDNVLIICPDYPYLVRRHYNIWNIITDIHKAHVALYKQIRDNLILLKYIKNYIGINGSKIGIIGYSFGVPFAAATTPLTTEIHNLALIYGGADLKQLIQLNLTKFHPVVNWLLSQIFWYHLFNFEPAKHARMLKEIPLLMINGKFDEKIPVKYSIKLQSAYNFDKDIFWLDSRHVHPKNKALSIEIINILRKWYLKIHFLE